MKPKQEFYAYILSIAAGKESITRKEIRRACREHYAISDKEWSVKKKDGNSKYANRVDWAVQDLRFANLIEPKERGILRVTALGKAALGWREEDLIGYVNKKSSETRRQSEERSSEKKSITKEKERGMKKIIIWSLAVLEITALAAMFFCVEHRMICGIVAAVVLLLILLLVLQGSKNVPQPPPPLSTPLPPAPHRPDTTDNPQKGDEKVSYFDNYVAVIESRHGKDSGKRMRHDVVAMMGGRDVSGREVVGRVDDILAHSTTRRAKGLVCGHCQEGKTGNFTGVITRAIDEGYNVILLLTANNTALRSQTDKRLREDLASAKLTAEKYHLLPDFLKEELPSLSDLSSGGIHIGIALKNIHQLGEDGEHPNCGLEKGHSKGIRGWLEGNSEFLRFAKVLIIDDEADSYTPDGNASNDSDWSDDIVDAYARAIELDAKDGEERTAKIVARWLRDLINSREDAYEGLAYAVNKMNSGRDANLIAKVRTLIAECKHCLGLEGKEDVGFGIQNGAERATLVESFFARSDISRTGHSFAYDFYSVMRWLVGIRRERTAINRAVCSLVRPKTFSPDFGQLVYIGYTATPYACFLNERKGADNPLDLDFAIPMSRSPEYLGLLEMFGCDENKNGSRLPIVESISQKEREELTLPLMSNDPQINDRVQLDDDLCYIYTSEEGNKQEGSWNSLKDAVMWAFCAAAVRRAARLRKDVSADEAWTWADRCSTMLVNLSRNMVSHDILETKLTRYLDKMLLNRETFKTQCLVVFNRLSHKLDAEHFKTELSDYPLEVKDVDRVAVVENLDWMLDHYEVISLNSDGENIGAYERYMQLNGCDRKDGDWLWFVIGGNRISRGLTFPGLVSSYFDRDKPGVNADTLIQMGRWLGYRVGYELLPRVWMPEGSVVSMKRICLMENNLHVQLHQMFEAGDSATNPKLRDISRRLTHADAGIKMTPPVENPFVTRFLKTGKDASKCGIETLAKFVRDCGKASIGIGGHIDERLAIWNAVSTKIVLEFLTHLEANMVNSSVEDLQRVVRKIMSEKCDSMDVVLANPQNRLPFVEIGSPELKVHPHGLSKGINLGNGCACFNKFSGQYDAWKAFAPRDVVERLRDKYGRENTKKAWDEMYKVKSDRQLPVRPIVQVGLIGAKDGPVPYAGIYWPNQENLVCGEIEQAKADMLELSLVEAKDRQTHVQRKGKNGTSLTESKIMDVNIDEKIIDEAKRLSRDICQDEQNSPFLKKKDIWDKIKSVIGESIPHDTKNRFSASPELYGWSKVDGKEVFYPIQRFETSDDAKQYAIDGVADAIAKKVAMLKSNVSVKELGEEFGLFSGIVSPEDILPPNGHPPRDVAASPKIQRLKVRGVEVLLCEGLKGSHLLRVLET